MHKGTAPLSSLNFRTSSILSLPLLRVIISLMIVLLILSFYVLLILERFDLPRTYFFQHCTYLPNWTESHHKIP